jgi:hypothetical protein
VFLETGKRLLAGDAARVTTSGEVEDLPREVRHMKAIVADLAPEERLLNEVRWLMGEARSEFQRLRLEGFSNWLRRRVDLH